VTACVVTHYVAAELIPGVVPLNCRPVSRWCKLGWFARPLLTIQCTRDEAAIVKRDVSSHECGDSLLERRCLQSDTALARCGVNSEPTAVRSLPRACGNRLVHSEGRAHLAQTSFNTRRVACSAFREVQIFSSNEESLWYFDQRFATRALHQGRRP